MVQIECYKCLKRAFFVDIEGTEGVFTAHHTRKNEMDIIPLEIPIRDQLKVLSLQLSVWVAKALYTQ